MTPITPWIERVKPGTCMDVWKTSTTHPAGDPTPCWITILRKNRLVRDYTISYAWPLHYYPVFVFDLCQIAFIKHVKWPYIAFLGPAWRWISRHRDAMCLVVLRCGISFRTFRVRSTLGWFRCLPPFLRLYRRSDRGPVLTENEPHPLWAPLWNGNFMSSFSQELIFSNYELMEIWAHNLSEMSPRLFYIVSDPCACDRIQTFLDRNFHHVIARDSPIPWVRSIHLRKTLAV